MTLHISAAQVEAILEQSRVEYPDECCGVILGPEGSDSAQVLKPMVNSAHSPTFYEFDSKDLLALYRELDEKSQEIVVVYHSHTETEAYPSRTDISYASEPSAHYVLVSTRKEIAPENEFRSYRIIDGIVTEEEVVILS
ncbi:MAG: Mov34/MPN/PAD-1 family protein [Candidatus Nanopelagicaceae bacterium]